MFRDESKEVVRKARARKSPKTREVQHQKASVTAVIGADIIDPAPVWNTHIRWPRNMSQQDPRMYTSRAFLDPATIPEAFPHIACESTIEEQGARFFMAHYISVSPKPDKSNSPFLGANPLVFLFGSKMTRDARICMGLAGLANVKDDQSIMVHARSRYASALRQTIEALQNPVEAKKDGTLGAAVMLAMFEIITCDCNSRNTWAGHIAGAAALLKGRGLHRLERRDDIRAFVQLCFGIFIKCLQSNEIVPPDIVEWFETSKEQQFEWDSPAWWLASIVSRFVTLRASIRKKKFTDSTAIISVMSALDAEMARWATELPPEWTFTTVISTEDSENIFESRCHVYHSVWVAILWNHYRAIRILVNNVLLYHLDLVSSLPLDDNRGSHQEQRRRSLVLVSRLPIDICYSIPFQLNHNGLAQRSNTKFAPTLTGAFTVLWPLRVAASTIGASEPLYQWVSLLLLSIGNRTGIKLALFMAKTMKEERETWQKSASTIRWGTPQLCETPAS
ncbi:hypothetical protein MMC18_002304 [Xylographa bjoerkii]|nr:hypothetical protein [Xylographa bjoerkii]